MALLKILVVRPDRLGDVILSTPVFQRIKSDYPSSHLSVLVKDNVVPLLKGLPSIDQCLTYDPEGRHCGLLGFYQLTQEIKAQGFNAALVLQSNGRIAAAIFCAGVPIRIGPLSKIHSFLFYNQGMRQNRSRVEMHEADYNLQLVSCLNRAIKAPQDIQHTPELSESSPPVSIPLFFPTAISVSDEVRSKAKTWLVAQGWKGTEPLVVVHPGMGGSALNWPERYYLELIEGLLAEKYSVLVIGGPTEHDLVNRVQNRVQNGVQNTLGSKSRHLGVIANVFFFKSAKDQGIEFLAGLFCQANLVVAPSTGPLHVAVALNKPVLTFYPPIQVQSPKRWGPYVPKDEKDVKGDLEVDLKNSVRAVVFKPDVECGQAFRCIGDRCRFYPCMESLSVAEAVKQAKSILKDLE